MAYGVTVLVLIGLGFHFVGRFWGLGELVGLGLPHFAHALRPNGRQNDFPIQLHHRLDWTHVWFNMEMRKNVQIQSQR